VLAGPAVVVAALAGVMLLRPARRFPAPALSSDPATTSGAKLFQNEQRSGEPML
jgi:hypothetical protein